jgi:uncharacterized protein
MLLLPAGFLVIVEVARKPADLVRGLAGRPRLLPCHGMLFVHPAPAEYHYWMNGVLIPLDIVWLDEAFTVVGVVADAAPGSLQKLGCGQVSKYALELAGGMAERYSLAIGDRLKLVG